MYAFPLSHKVDIYRRGFGTKSGKGSVYDNSRIEAICIFVWYNESLLFGCGACQSVSKGAPYRGFEIKTKIIRRWDIIALRDDDTSAAVIAWDSPNQWSNEFVPPIRDLGFGGYTPSTSDMMASLPLAHKSLSDSESDSPPAYSDDDANETDASSSSDYANDVDVRSSSDDASDVDVSSSSDDANDVDVSSSSDDANDVDVSSSRASAHEDAQQCEICKKWFDSYWQYDDHVEENNSGCWQHKECFPQSDNFRHARESHHQKCFVGGCKSLYAEDSDNDDKDIMDHIWDEHTIRG
ncbi:MAG: hypothetical protein LQ339_007428 [Xanthoria mediterranea]|nr:MAG: hypothetical protein LQ339_007428 [Xanthoria mediterranea]